MIQFYLFISDLILIVALVQPATMLIVIQVYAAEDGDGGLESPVDVALLCCRDWITCYTEVEAGAYEVEAGDYEVEAGEY